MRSRTKQLNQMSKKILNTTDGLSLTNHACSIRKGGANLPLPKTCLTVRHIFLSFFDLMGAIFYAPILVKCYFFFESLFLTVLNTARFPFLKKIAITAVSKSAMP